MAVKSVDIRHLQYFMETARQGSFTKAAEKLHVSQPTISKMIKGIEEELGTELIDRSGKRIELTDAGRMILAQAENIVRSFEHLSSDLDDLLNLKKGTLRIGLPPMAGAGYFPEALGLFHERHPGIALELVEDGAKKMEADIAAGTLNIGVVLLPTKRDDYHSIPISEEPVHLLVPSSHRLAGRQEASLAELAGEPFILFGQEFALRGRIRSACIQAGFEPAIVCESSQWDLIGKLVAAGLGISLLPESICRQVVSDKARAIRLVRPSIPWALAMIWRKDKYLSPAERAWLQFAESYFKGGRG
nr:LysR family transcriptional regulator [Cohnella algarum]